ERLTHHPRIDASDIEVKVQNGEVTLTGAVENRQFKHMVEDLVESISGVKEVNNQLRVNQNQSWQNQPWQTQSGQGQSGQSQWGQQPLSNSQARTDQQTTQGTEGKGSQTQPRSKSAMG